MKGHMKGAERLCRAVVLKTDDAELLLNPAGVCRYPPSHTYSENSHVFTGLMKGRVPLQIVAVSSEYAFTSVREDNSSTSVF